MQLLDPKQILSIFMLSLIAAGCASKQVPLQPFHGLKHIYQTQDAVLNVVFVHGMGDHPFGEPGVLQYQKSIAHELGFKEDGVNRVTWGHACKWPRGVDKYRFFSPIEKTRIEVRQQADQAVCQLRIHDVVVGFIGWRQYQSLDDGRILNLFELSWDKATELLQKQILELDNDYFETIEVDDDGNYVEGGVNREADRAFVNRLLKQFVNQNLGDPVIYLGSFGNSIRQTIAEGLATISLAVDNRERNNNNYSIISDSLGSRIVFDILGCVLESNNDPLCTYLTDKTLFTIASKEKLNELASKTTQVFMNANQLPFLALSQVQPPRAGEDEKQWLSRFPCEGDASGMMTFLSKRSDAEDPLQIVAFTDPNDVLSYHLTERFQKKCAYVNNNTSSPIDYVNVRIRNVKWTYFGLFANPLQAHSDGFRSNPKAINLLVNGNETYSGH